MGQGTTPEPVVVAQRPTILPNRWQENWSALADPRIKRERFDNLKYIPLSNDDPGTYLSLGLNARGRLETNRGEFFGIPPSYEGEWLLSRLEAHADLRLGKHIQVFTQIQSAYAPGKAVRAPIDQDRLDVEQAFVGITHALGGGTFTLRAGRQLIDVDLQRFLSMRDGPNLRQPYDAALVEYRRGGWRLGGLYSQPVQIRDRRPFDDFSDRRLTASGILIRRPVMGSSEVSVYYLHYRRGAAHFTSASGDERREIVDVRLKGAANGFDWDIEAMNQTGRIGSQAIDAWAFGSVVGYTLANTNWTPHLGLGVDAASGDRNPHDDRLETFNPLFPEGYFLAGYTGYVNFIHVKPARDAAAGDGVESDGGPGHTVACDHGRRGLRLPQLSCGGDGRTARALHRNVRRVSGGLEAHCQLRDRPGSRALRDRHRGSPGGRPRRQLRWRRTQICVVRLFRRVAPKLALAASGDCT